MVLMHGVELDHCHADSFRPNWFWMGLMLLFGAAIWVILGMIVWRVVRWLIGS
jgi:hypothetical protein